MFEPRTTFKSEYTTEKDSLRIDFVDHYLFRFVLVHILMRRRQVNCFDEMFDRCMLTVRVL